MRVRLGIIIDLSLQPPTSQRSSQPTQTFQDCISGAEVKAREGERQGSKRLPTCNVGRAASTLPAPVAVRTAGTGRSTGIGRGAGAVHMHVHMAWCVCVCVFVHARVRA